MGKWLRRVRGVLGMALAWAVAGALVGGLFELIDNVLPGALPFISEVDMWPATLAIPGFVSGAVFGVVLGIAGSRRRFDELSLPQFAAWGAVTGLLLGGLGVYSGAPAFFMGIMTLWGAGAASVSLALARLGEQPELVGAGVDTSEPELTASEASDLLGDGR